MKGIIDLSALLDGRVLEYKNIKELVVPSQILEELETLWKEGSTTALAGLNNLKRLKGHFNVKVVTGGPIQLAQQDKSVLITADPYMRAVAEVQDIPVIFLEPHIKEHLSFEEFFEDGVMSIHVKENCPITRKVGKPGEWRLEVLDKRLTPAQIKRLAEESVEYAEQDKASFIEYEDPSMSILQLRDYRVVVAKPPFADAFEITITKPVVQREIDDYSLPKKLLKKLYHAEGILISGSPGSGKSTFASALARFFLSKRLVVKTLENPRDLHLPSEISQYDAREDKVVDALLLTRPDRVIFDEVRDERDFNHFIELRMAGIGMVGVVHASRPIDAIQRFLGKAEMGLIPQIIDTVLFIKGGDVKTVLELKQRMKVPAGMLHEDLSRPVIVVSDFQTGKPLYEIYKFGEEAVVMDLKQNYPELYQWKNPWRIEGRRVIVEGISKREAKEWSKRLRKRGLRVEPA